MERISQHISYKEATYSATAKRENISNEPTEEHLRAMKQLAEKVFEPVRKHFARPILVNSFYRSPELNAASGGSSRSQHRFGEAIDIDATNGFTNADIFHFIKDNLDWDQMIWEFGDDTNPNWVHVSYKLTGTNRRKLTQAVKIDGKTRYIEWKDDNADSAPATRTGTVNVNTSLNVRNAPNGDKVGSLPNGTQVNIHEEKEDWFKVSTAQIEGWVAARFVSE